jgi:hypothetical protein
VRVKASEVVHYIGFGGKALVEVKRYPFGEAAEVVVVEVTVIYSRFGDAFSRVW